MLKLVTNFSTILTLTVLMSCGKKANETSSSEPGSAHHQNQTPDSILRLPVNKKMFYYSPGRAANIKLPSALIVYSANALGKIVTVSYNLLPQSQDEFEFQCIYKGTTETAMPLSKCTDPRGNNLGNIADGRPMPIDDDKLVRIQSNSSELDAEIVFEASWI